MLALPREFLPLRIIERIQLCLRLCQMRFIALHLNQLIHFQLLLPLHRIHYLLMSPQLLVIQPPQHLQRLLVLGGIVGLLLQDPCPRVSLPQRNIKRRSRPQLDCNRKQTRIPQFIINLPQSLHEFLLSLYQLAQPCFFLLSQLASRPPFLLLNFSQTSRPTFRYERRLPRRIFPRCLLIICQFSGHP